MESYELSELLAKRKKAELVDLLVAAHDEMSARQRQDVFGSLITAHRLATVDGEDLLAEVRDFHEDSLSGAYYAPFDMNSKNYMHIPEETEEWCARMAEYLKGSAKLTELGDHTHAVACFRLLYELICAMDEGEEIVFAEEVGSWMIPVEEKDIIASYLVSLAATSTPEEFAEAVCPLIRRDGYESFALKVNASANHTASKEQRAQLKAEIKRRGIRLSSQRGGSR